MYVGGIPLSLVWRILNSYCNAPDAGWEVKVTPKVETFEPQNELFKLTTGIDGVYSFARQESLGADNFDLTGVSIYPNPNNGEFTLSLNSASGKVNVGIYDIRGRLILDRVISNTGIVNENINLTNVQSGVYLITIQDGNRKTTKKIVVE